MADVDHKTIKWIAFIATVIGAIYAVVGIPTMREFYFKTNKDSNQQMTVVKPKENEKSIPEVSDYQFVSEIERAIRSAKADSLYSIRLGLKEKDMWGIRYFSTNLDVGFENSISYYPRGWQYSGNMDMQRC